MTASNPIKRLPKDLKEEGITIELIDRILRMKKYSPVQFEKGDEPVNIMRANDKEFWVVLPGGEFLKDEGRYVKYDFKTCLLARARYLVNFEKKEKKKRVKEEITRLKKLIDEKVEETIKSINELFEWHEFDPDKEQEGLKGILVSVAKQMGGKNSPFLSDLERKKEYAESIFKNSSKESFENFKQQLLDLQKNDQYDKLYQILVTDGLPLIVSVKPNVESEMEVFKKFFHADKIEDTVKMISKKSHLEVVATINIEKEYL